MASTGIVTTRQGVHTATRPELWQSDQHNQIPPPSRPEKLAEQV